MGCLGVEASASQCYPRRKRGLLILVKTSWAMDYYIAQLVLMDSLECGVSN